MPTATLDTIQNTSLEITGGVHRYVRGGYVEGLNASLGTADILYQCVSANGMPGFGTSLSSAYSGVLLSRMQVTPLSDDTAAVQLYYETIQGLISSAYVITDDSFLASAETNLVTGTRQPIHINDFQVKDATGKTTALVPADNLSVTFMRPMRQLSVYQLLAGSPRSNYSSAIGCVNDDKWQDLPVGCWLLSQYKTEISKYQGFYTRTATAMTRAVGPTPEDWSETGMLKNSMIGKYIEVDAKLITANLKLPYDHGLIGANAVDKFGNPAFGDGFARVGQYQLANFALIFGFK